MRAFSLEENPCLQDYVTKSSFKDNQRPNFATNLEQIEEEYKTITDLKVHTKQDELEKPIEQSLRIEFVDEVTTAEGRQKFEKYLKTLC